MERVEAGKAAGWVVARVEAVRVAVMAVAMVAAATVVVVWAVVETVVEGAEEWRAAAA